MRPPVLRLSHDELIADNFAGGGGASLGIEWGLGRSPDIAINHDAEAIAMHQANHPGTKHFTESIWKVDPREVWRRKQYMKGQHGAPCSLELKRKLLAKFQVPGDTIVIGYDAGEADRFEDLVERNPETIFKAPLIERGLSKADCLAMVERAGIELPLMYRQGFENANCPGCPKGGEGYWNRIRIVRPAVFAEAMEIQEGIGEGAYFFRVRDTGVRFGLKDLDPAAGRHDEPAPSCSFFCSLAEDDIRKAA